MHHETSSSNAAVKPQGHIVLGTHGRQNTDDSPTATAKHNPFTHGNKLTSYARSRHTANQDHQVNKTRSTEPAVGPKLLSKPRHPTQRYRSITTRQSTKHNKTHDSLRQDITHLPHDGLRSSLRICLARFEYHAIDKLICYKIKLKEIQPLLSKAINVSE